MANLKINVVKNYVLIFCFLLLSCIEKNNDDTTQVMNNEKENAISSMLDEYHAAASRADYDTYFDFLAEESVFIGTDATEVWKKPEFMEWSKPYFQRGKAWDFKVVKRNIYFSDESSTKVAWFDELLNTQMGLCRGSGVVSLESGKWKIKHYVLSLTIPNEQVDKIIPLKREFEK